MSVPALKAMPHIFDINTDYDKWCSICFEDFRHQEELLGHPSHWYHPNCLNTALKVNALSCPNCRTPLFSDEVPHRPISESVEQRQPARRSPFWNPVGLQSRRLSSRQILNHYLIPPPTSNRFNRIFQRSL